VCVGVRLLACMCTCAFLVQSGTYLLLLLQIPPTHSLLKIPELKEEAGMAIGKLLQLTTSSTISSVNLMTVIVCLTNVAKQRPLHFSTVVQAFELLHGECDLELSIISSLVVANLPPSYSPSQVSSVRKQLKVCM